ncbi:MAG: hypothetical protein JWL59_1304 [Chthoniobacteraceae bacterium]|nr:hypothetical protein [Chthoniobacteraceae bacterium]
MSPRMSRFFLAVSVFNLSACTQVPDVFASGRDGRSFNAATGRYEWGEESAPVHSRQAAGRTQGRTDSNQPAARSEDRPFNPATGRFE